MMRAIAPFTSVKKIRTIVSILVPLSILLLVYILPQDDLKTLLMFAVLIVIFSIYKFDSRIPIIYGILLLVLVGILTSQKVDEAVKRIAVLSYWFLAVGIICILISLYINKKPSTEEPDRQLSIE